MAVTGFFYRNWAEVGFFILLVIGFAFSTFSTSAVVSYILIFIVGLMAGRLMLGRKRKITFPVYLMLLGFLIGFIVGAPFGNKGTMFVLFLLGGFLSYQAHKRGFLRDLKFRS